MERTPITSPLPCYGLAQDPLTEKCRQCPHFDPCGQFMGQRRNRITLDKIEFNLIPEQFDTEDLSDQEDPDAGMIQSVYIQCHNTIFKEATEHPVRPFKREIIANAKAAGLSLRTFMMAVMFGWEQTRQNALGHTDTRLNKFHPKRLTENRAIKLADEYVLICQKRFGAFTLSSLQALTGEDYEKNSVEQHMLVSEVTAGIFIVGWKLRHGGPPEPALFASRELDLNAYWLASEASYRRLILEPYMKEHFGSQVQRRHRSAAIQCLSSMKRNKPTAIAAFYSRQRVAAEALVRVLQTYGYRPTNFEVAAVPVADMMQFWTWLARAIQQMEALKFLEQTPSLLDKFLRP